ENRDVDDPFEIEAQLNRQFPFFEYLQNHDLQKYSRHFNPNIKFATHHLCHASAARFMSPFDKAVILVIDGAGSRLNLFNENNPESALIDSELIGSSAEERSVYLLDNGNIKCVKKEVQTFQKSLKHPEHYFSEGLGSFYEKISEFIFNSKRSAGKVMGFAALAQPNKIANSIEYLENLDWSKAFKGGSKKDWQESPNQKFWAQIAADAQGYFEQEYIGYILNLKKIFPEYTNLIITGGCALNCTSNMKIVNTKVFDNVYVPPFPGDECISLGAATLAQYEITKEWLPTLLNRQHGYFGPRTSVPDEKKILQVFKGFEMTQAKSITQFTAELLNQGHVVAWFQGRSESGPRSLGNRSILARPDKSGMKNYLNEHIKFRENFRPYGSSVLFEKSHLYFEVPEGFDNPYMSFATTVKAPYAESLKEVTHLDKTSRMQTVRKTQNEKFYDLIEKFGQLSGLYCLLNTSFNIMGEPIVETLEDAAKFLQNVPVYGLAVGDYFIKRK
ncbi:MAG: carbamoyltransferase C-terminal domain-containing protein, partial [Pseudobdellovibrio sp.]